MIGRLWHSSILRHTITRVTRLTVPMWDPFARGVLIRCSCGKAWAL